MDKELINKRFNEAVAYLIDNRYAVKLVEIAEKLDIAKSRFAEIRGGRMNANTDIIARLAQNYPQISLEWIMLGKGTIEKDTAAPPTTTNHNQYCIQKDQTLPLLPMSAVAGWNGVDIEGVNFDDCERMFVPYLVEAGAEYLIRAVGTSMFPTYSSGDILACRRVREARFIQWGKVYVIDSTEGPMVKRIKKSDNEECILCCSDNPEYEPFELVVGEIRSLSLVVGSIHAD